MCNSGRGLVCGDAVGPGDLALCVNAVRPP